jgi:hypothetical protein
VIEHQSVKERLLHVCGLCRVVKREVLSVAPTNDDERESKHAQLLCCVEAEVGCMHGVGCVRVAGWVWHVE